MSVPMARWSRRRPNEVNGGDHGHSCIHGAVRSRGVAYQELHAGNALPVLGLTA